MKVPTADDHSRLYAGKKQGRSWETTAIEKQQWSRNIGCSWEAAIEKQCLCWEIMDQVTRSLTLDQKTTIKKQGHFSETTAIKKQDHSWETIAIENQCQEPKWANKVALEKQQWSRNEITLENNRGQETMLLLKNINQEIRLLLNNSNQETRQLRNNSCSGLQLQYLYDVLLRGQQALVFTIFKFISKITYSNN